MLAPERTRPRMKLTKLRAIWRDQVFANLELSYSTRVIGYALAEYITMGQTEQTYRETGKVIIFPSQETLSEKTGANIDTVKVAISVLIDHGHLTKLSQGNQFTGANRYQVRVGRSA